MKFTLSVFTLVLLLTACRRREDSQLPSDDEMRKKLPGIWLFEAKFADGSIIHGTTTISPDGSSLTGMEIPGRTNGPRIISMEGTFQVKDGFLIETPTKYSDTNVPVPGISRA
jgi:hypothetical protein